jgi:hypothetical protein
VLEVVDFKELVLWLCNKFDSKRRVIQIQGESLISLAPLVFRRMLRLPNPTMTLKNVEVDDFIKSHSRGIKFLEIFLISPTRDVNVTHVEVRSLKYPYK